MVQRVVKGAVEFLAVKSVWGCGLPVLGKTQQGLELMCGKASRQIGDRRAGPTRGRSISTCKAGQN